MSEPVSYQISASTSGPSVVIRKVNGTPVKLEMTEEERDAYVTPPNGEYRLRITGFYEPFLMPIAPAYRKENGPTEQRMTRLEFEIQEGKGAGKRFSALVGWTVGPRSNLGCVWRAAVGEIPATAEMTDLLDRELTMYVVRTEKVDEAGNKKVYANPTWKTASPVGAELDAEDAWPAA